MSIVDGVDRFPDSYSHVTACFVSTSLVCGRIVNVDIRCSPMIHMARVNTEYFREIRRVILSSHLLYPSFRLNIHFMY